jgi:hypothetical protein
MVNKLMFRGFRKYVVSFGPMQEWLSVVFVPKESFFGISILILILFPVSAFSSQVISVPDDYSRIQSAIDKANEHSVIKVDTGVYLENINFQGKSIIVKSQNPNDSSIVRNTVISGTGTNKPVVSFINGEDTSTILTGFTIQYGKGSEFLIGHREFDSNDTEFVTGGGGIQIRKSSPSITNLIIRRNKGIGRGGGILVYRGNPIIFGNIIKNNSAGAGAGISIDHKSRVLIQNNKFIHNRVSDVHGGGGAIYLWSCSQAVIQENLFSKNGAMRGGNILYESSSEIDLSENKFHNRQIEKMSTSGFNCD